VSRGGRHRWSPLAADGHGFTLIELCVATAVLAVVLAAAYGWLWGVGALARSTDDRAQALTLAGVVTRCVTADVAAAVAVAPPPAGRDPERSICLVRDAAGVAPEGLTIVWDPARRVVWRNASGTYVADHVSSFRVGYRLADGRGVDGVTIVAGDWEHVRAVVVTVVVQVGRSSVRRDACVRLGCG
jgi:prepilin-type N-terminal cleavage/methylation domain-containing protein